MRMPRWFSLFSLALLLLAAPGSAEANSIAEWIKIFASVRFCPEVTFVSSDPANCGGCGVVCDTDENCCFGSCVNKRASCGGCGSAFVCGASQECCGHSYDGLSNFKCTDTSTDPYHCGSCMGRTSNCPLNHLVGNTLTACCSNGQCVTPEGFQSDVRNCGDCGEDCGDGVCSKGHCCLECQAWFDGGPNGIGAGCYSCDEVNRITSGNLRCCSTIVVAASGITERKICADLNTDTSHCGSCLNDCVADYASGAWCVNARCTCPPKYPDKCGSQCVNLWDTQSGGYCGRCGLVCNPESQCCASVGDRRPPGCVTTDLTTDWQHCGACNHQCPDGYDCCGAWNCKDIRNDPANCGSCGRACPESQYCFQGDCVNEFVE